LFIEALNFKKIVPIIKNQAVNLQTIGRMKSQRIYQILVVLMLILPLRILAQQQIPPFAQKIPHISEAPRNFAAKTINGNNSNISCLSLYNDSLPRLPINPFPFRTAITSASFVIQNLPFFCRKEFLFEKSTSVPLRLRLGSLDYVNKLEGKENHWSAVPGN